jgi:hypothetical protein
MEGFFRKTCDTIPDSKRTNCGMRIEHVQPDLRLAS